MEKMLHTLPRDSGSASNVLVKRLKAEMRRREPNYWDNNGGRCRR